MSIKLSLLIFLYRYYNVFYWDNWYNIDTKYINAPDKRENKTSKLSNCYEFIYLMRNGHKWWCLWIDEVVSHDIFLCLQIHSRRQVTWGPAADWHLVISPLTSHSCRSRHSDIFPSRPIRVNSSPRFKKIKYGNFIKVLVFCASCSRSFRGGTYCFL